MVSPALACATASMMDSALDDSSVLDSPGGAVAQPPPCMTIASDIKPKNRRMLMKWFLSQRCTARVWRAREAYVVATRSPSIEPAACGKGRDLTERANREKPAPRGRSIALVIIAAEIQRLAER